MWLSWVLNQPSMLIPVSPGKVDLYGLVNIKEQFFPCVDYEQRICVPLPQWLCIWRGRQWSSPKRHLQSRQRQTVQDPCTRVPHSLRGRDPALVQPACASHPAPLTMRTPPLWSAIPLISAPTCASGHARSSGRWNGRSTRRSCPAHRCRHSYSNAGAGMHLWGSPGHQLGP